MGFRATTWSRPKLIQACNFLKDTGNVTDDLMNTVCMQADKMSANDTLTLAIWSCGTPHAVEVDDGRYDGKIEQCYYDSTTCPTGSTFTREAVDNENKRLYCCDDGTAPIEVTAEAVINASGTPTQEQFDAIINSSQASEKEKAKEKARYKDEMDTLMAMLVEMERQGKFKHNEAYELLLTLQTVKKEFSEEMIKLTENITDYFSGGKNESESVRLMQEKIREQGVVMRVFNVIWENVKWITRAAASLFVQGATWFARHYVYMLVYHPATLRFFIYTAMEVKAEFCARFGMIRRIPKKTVWEKVRMIPATTLATITSTAAWTYAAILVLIEENMAFQKLEGLLAYIMDPVYNLAVLPALSIIFGASASATAIIYGMLQFGGRVAGRAFGRMLEAQMWKYNAVSSLIDTKNWFFDWSNCVRDVETEQEVPVPCPGMPWAMCYQSEVQQYKMQVGTKTVGYGKSFAPTAPGIQFAAPSGNEPETTSTDEFYTPNFKVTPDFMENPNRTPVFVPTEPLVSPQYPTASPRLRAYSAAASQFAPVTPEMETDSDSD